MENLERRVLLMGFDGPVLRDLLGALKEKFPNLTSTMTRTPEETVREIETGSMWHYAFLNMGPYEFMGSDLAKRMEEMSTAVILYGNSAEDTQDGSPFPVLMRPFLPMDIFAILGNH